MYRVIASGSDRSVERRLWASDGSRNAYVHACTRLTGALTGYVWAFYDPPRSFSAALILSTAWHGVQNNADDYEGHRSKPCRTRVPW